MKSTQRDLNRFDTIVKSFCEITPHGTAQSIETSFECSVPDYWSDETKAYYNKLMTQTSTDWGFFCASMPSDNSSSYSTTLTKLNAEQARLEAAFDHSFEIIPTYTHIAYGSTPHRFPNNMASETAGGNGFNGKPVLQFTYQFTTLNNSDLSGYTPMFDILRGKYDDQFRELAQDIKAYGKPVLFRLNNEMNTDWTSYCGIISLLDPDVFIMTWERLYDIFLEEGVDNCIWIWNPIATSCPYSNWGEALNYLPELDYVQALGLTYYEMNNGSSVSSFSSMYTTLYNKNMPWFDNYPWIISEFACGAGGEKLYNWGTSSYNDTVLGRNQALQAQWVKGMFKALNDKENNAFASHIKGAVWFSVNDYATIQGKSYITNKLSITDDLTQTIAAFKEGFAASKEE
ncbi:MAG TPA: glycosyl hydrolase, partial [Bacillota bacterium]|nr:glycosyl hydrolase [Bacillota bacterium]